MNISYESICKLLIEELPGEKAHRKMLPPGRILKPAPKDQSKIKHSSVLLLLFMKKNDLYACLIKRPTHMKHHAGQIALPGGRMELNETAKETAIRETFEEIGVPQNEIQVIGELSKFYVEVSRFEICPIVGWIEHEPRFNASKDEVEKIILFPVKQFKPPYQEIELNTITGKLKVPCVKFGNEIIWGATAMILSEFYEITKHMFN